MTEDMRSRGLTSYQEGEYDTAIAAFAEARNRLKDIGDRHGEAEMLTNLGVAHQRMGKLEPAQLAFEESLEIFTALGELEGQAIAFGNLGNLLLLRGDSGRAVGYLERAIDIFGERGQREQAAATWTILARAYLKEKQWIDAIAAYDQSLYYTERLSASQRLMQGLIGILLRVMGVPR
ncbi:MAG: tetratricopeptide repeat protein [Chloroflexi bacterium]|nr:tetratricopeptide repeat protein [Chloroflexota bacterium]